MKLKKIKTKELERLNEIASQKDVEINQYPTIIKDLMIERRRYVREILDEYSNAPLVFLFTTLKELELRIKKELLIKTEKDKSEILDLELNGFSELKVTEIDEFNQILIQLNGCNGSLSIEKAKELINFLTKQISNEKY